jgi:hypothetical protein
MKPTVSVNKINITPYGDNDFKAAESLYKGWRRFRCINS